MKHADMIRIERQLRKMMENPRPCVLCGSTRKLIAGVFIPTSEFSRKLGAPAGKIRVMVYCVCHNCKRKPDCSDLIDNYFLSAFKGLDGREFELFDGTSEGNNPCEGSQS